MLNWIYDIVVSIFTFIVSLFGCDLKKKVTFAEDVKPEEGQVEAESIPDTPDATE